MTDLVERTAAIAARARVEIPAKRALNRERMPLTAALLDDIRLHFDKPAYFKLTENGLTVEWLNPEYTRDEFGRITWKGTLA